MWYVLAILAILVLIVLYLISIFNKLVRLRERVRNAYSQIDVQLERRHDLIPNLIEVAKKYMSHERETLEAVVNARAAATQAKIEVSGDPANLEAMKKMAGAEAGLAGALGKLMAVAESYPDLKANQNMSELTEELTTTENKISFARQSYNDQVTSYQVYKTTFPPALIANPFGFNDAAYLDLDDEPEKRENIKVSFDDPEPNS